MQFWLTHIFMKLASEFQDWALIYSLEHMWYQQYGPRLALTLIPKEIPW